MDADTVSLATPSDTDVTKLLLVDETSDLETTATAGADERAPSLVIKVVEPAVAAASRASWSGTVEPVVHVVEATVDNGTGGDPTIDARSVSADDTTAVSPFPSPSKDRPLDASMLTS